MEAHAHTHYPILNYNDGNIEESKLIKPMTLVVQSFLRWPLA